MGFVGLVALALLAAVPAAARSAPGAVPAVTARLARAALVTGVLAVPAVLTGLARGAAGDSGYDYAAAWNSLYDGSNDGRLSGIEVSCSLLGAVLVAPLARRSVAASGRARRRLLGAGLAAGAVALGSTRFPDAMPVGDWGRTVFSTLMWLLHLIGGGVWLGGLAGLLLLAAPGAVREALPEDARGAFWSGTIRRFSVCAMASVAAITLSGLFLYWEHVDGPGQLLSTMYGRVLGVKILIFGALLLLGVFNQFWLHPRIEALRAAGDQRPLRTLLLRRFPLVVAVEVVCGLLLLFVAPFLHGSARNQAYQARVAEHSATAVPAKRLPRLAPKQADASTWVYGTLETLAVVGLMGAGYRYSGRLARRRATAAAPAVGPLRAPDLTEA
ncbi:CopD family protein [Streptacidiphilus sp. P02-A3a]|nr:CopD family protein [Streptacidiphilus sp. P02-A3a]